ncbi:hypothetical protein [Tenacibaculum jejuense]|uniref:Probable lipoprotein n=1 Tax=Tenacibaculum jejuense TaxID=584609 RepID=A0A238UAK8_9FLAO|nr:hypothetical protein [Tenacibaculum jejuense]SNR15608.1 Probable lipoprotein precursor [Tenacibaculum jejuense]
MKKYYTLFLLLIITVSFSSCSSEDDSNNNDSEFAMTAVINGEVFEANNPFGTNEFSSTNIWNYYPIEDFVMLQARDGGIVGTREINIWLKRTDITPGVYNFGPDTFTTPPSHFIRMFELTNDISELTRGGKIEIKSVNTTDKIVEGTFEFTTSENPDDPSSPIDFTVTEGKFRYKYE